MQMDGLSGLMNVGMQEIKELITIHSRNKSTLEAIRKQAITNELFRWAAFQQRATPWSALLNHVNDMKEKYNNEVNFASAIVPTNALSYLKEISFAVKARADYSADSTTRRN